MSSNPISAVLGGIAAPFLGGMKQNHAEAPQIVTAVPNKAVDPGPVDPTAVEQARVRDLENSRKTTQQSLRIDLANPSQGGSGVFIPS